MIAPGSGAGPQAVHHAWNMGGKIFDLAPHHLARLAEMIEALPDKPADIRMAEIQLAESAGLRRLAELLDIPEDMLFYRQEQDADHWGWSKGRPQDLLDLIELHAGLYRFQNRLPHDDNLVVIVRGGIERLAQVAAARYRMPGLVVSPVAVEAWLARRNLQLIEVNTAGVNWPDEPNFILYKQGTFVREGDERIDLAAMATINMEQERDRRG